MRDAHTLERAVGIEYYASDVDGTGGRLRESPDDFRVTEIENFNTYPIDADTGDYPWLVLRATLTRWDTNDFARELANLVGISRERVTWAGTKDRNAITTQLFAIRGLDPEEIPEIDNADIEVVGRAGRSLQFGDLAGNEFRVVVREPVQPEQCDDISDDLREFVDSNNTGVPNFFGQQRFGSYRPVTHEVGLAIVHGDWEDAAMAYLGNPSEHEPDESREAREYVSETRDWEGALDEFPGHLRYERTMLHELASGGDFRDAIETFPSNLQRLFVNAAQSYAFNLMLSERLACGLPFHKPVAGDIVWFAEADSPGDVARPDSSREQRVTESRVDVMTRHCERGRAFVTAPLVGTDTEFGDDDPGNIEREVLSKLDLTPSDFDLPGEFTSWGTRRAILLHPTLSIERDPLTFEFALPSGSYATVVLREFLKTSPLNL